MSEKELQLVESKPLAEPSVAGMLQSVIQSGVTTENVEVIERMMALYERDQDRQAQVAFAEAFAALQADIPKVTATKPVPGNNGETRYCFAPYEQIMKQVQPMLTKLGFSVSYSSKWDGPRLLVTCTLTHIKGFSRQNEFAARVGDGPPKASPAQADGAVLTYAKRQALCSALNIVIDHDDDARGQDVTENFITANQALDLESLCEETKSNKAEFLKVAPAESFATIPAKRYEYMLGLLEKKQRRAQG